LLVACGSSGGPDGIRKNRAREIDSGSRDASNGRRLRGDCRRIAPERRLRRRIIGRRSKRAARRERDARGVTGRREPRGGEHAERGGGQTWSPRAARASAALPANIVPGAAFSAGVGWWYNWAATTSAPERRCFVRADWRGTKLRSTRRFLAGSQFILGFNEPNFKAQANLTADAAAAQWKTLQQNRAPPGCRSSRRR